MLDPLLGQTDAPDVARPCRLGLGGPDHKLRRATADVYDQERPVPRIEVRGGTGEGEAPLGHTGQQLGSESNDGLGCVEELISVGGIPSSRGGGDTTPGHAVGVHGLAVLSQDGQHPFDGL